MANSTQAKYGRKHVVIVGAGAAGMSCAATLMQHPDRYRVTIIEKAGVCGGQATSISLDASRHGASWLNDGVQGGSPIFRHTMQYFRRYGYEPREIHLQVSFGKGKDGFWTNVFRSPLVEKYQKDIHKFGRVLKLIKLGMPVLGLIPIRIMLRIFGFSRGFGDQMVYPLIALFLGTGNQTANVACAILERLFDDPNMKLWDYSPDTLLPNLPTMITFPKMHDFYVDWAADLESKGVEFQLNTSVEEVVSRNARGVTLRTRGWDAAPDNNGGSYTTETSQTLHYDELALCTLADEALRILGKTASLRERFVLGGAAFFDDITVTHSDREYFDSVYETQFSAERCADAKSQETERMIAFARGEQVGPHNEPPGFRPMYYTHSYAEDPKKIEMSFDCTHYQHQFREGEAQAKPQTKAQPEHSQGQRKAEPQANGDTAQRTPESDQTALDAIAWDQHVFQSIFLDWNQRHLWTRSAIQPAKIIAQKWWHQLGHRWQHYVRVVPWMPLLQGRRSTWFAGSWTLVNMHELACVSGISVAWRLGAEYEYFDDFAEDFFQRFVALNHWRWYRKQKGNDKGRKRKDL
jgi:predicted NAD/FAD-binding protein